MKLTVKEGPTVKVVHSDEYNYIFNKSTGLFIRYGKDIESDAIQAPAPEIADIEISDGKCSGNCKYCLIPGTKISMKNGKTKNIEDIKIGDQVISYSEDNCEKTVNSVKELYKRAYCGVLISIELDNGRTIKITPEHEVFTKSFGWVEAKNLTKDMEIIYI